ncbi:hypothetical protein MS3_00000821 [Schistosoma haematobium]|uniref:Uncharacterized protein n=1 Tax=Schistosoma haematobium TaxID=6185 RepID=A0A922S660_SCHHA|nr:hypothetical protein MS3_00000821 [Schistosoma haematobium]KAH9595219.1 hypothetical protein MS3_00000821 [Schistosoma haematobium]
MMLVIVIQVPAPYSITVLIFVLKIVTLILADSCSEFHMLLNCENSVVVLTILASMSASDPPRSSMMKPRYVNLSTSSRNPPSVSKRLTKHVNQYNIEESH